MALIVFLFSVFFISGLFAAFQEQQEVTVEPGQEATLQCRAPPDAAVLLLEWNRADLSSEDYVFFYREDRLYPTYQHPSFRGRVRLRDPSSVGAGDVSVVLQNVSSRDAGTYTCRVTAGRGGSGGEHTESEHRISLTVATADPPEGTTDEGTTDEGTTDEGTTDEGDGGTGAAEDAPISPIIIIIVVSVIALLSLVASLGFAVAYRHSKAVSKRSSEKARAEKEAGRQMMERI
ncbi:uncharacterized protein PAE49_021364 [Odontesthes bonariensis]|uniref:uncharacterized protein LOC142369083 n=1 Tax=Odontesthes bonariensis TaxID=219752 RepID=UPI003F58DC7E